MNDVPSHAFAAARRIFRRSVDRGTFLSTFCLPSPKRDALHAVGAFIRLIRDAILGGAGAHSGACGAATAADLLELAHERIEAIWSDQLDTSTRPPRDETHWTLLAVARSVRQFEIPRAPVIDLANAWAGAAKVRRYATWRSLGEHCERTAGNVAVLTSAILGSTHSDAPCFAVQVGQATRLTAILHGLATDLSHGRMLLPLEDLARVGCRESDIVARRPTRALGELIHLQVERARALLRAGAGGIPWLAGDGSRLAAAGHVSRQLALLDAIDRAPERILTGRVQVSPWRQLRRWIDVWRVAQPGAAAPLARLH